MKYKALQIGTRLILQNRREGREDEQPHITAKSRLLPMSKQLGHNLIMGNTMTDKEKKPLEKHTKREILEFVCTQKGWDIKGELATSLNRSSKNVLLEWLRDLV